jgi:HK97 family phage major capsid protein
MTNEEIAALAGDIRKRLDAVGEKVSDEALEARIATAIDHAISKEDSPLKRRALFGEPKLAGSKYGRSGMSVADLEFLHGVLVDARAHGQSKGPSQDLDNAIKELSEGRYENVVEGPAGELAQLEGLYADGKIDKPTYARSIGNVRARAMDTAESGYGSQLIGAQYIGELWAGARAQSRVFGLLPTFQMDAPTVYLPVEAAVPALTFVGESTSATITNYTTVKTGSNKVQVDAKKFVIAQVWSGEMEEDSIIPYIPFLRGQQVRSLAHYSDALVINGDTTTGSTLNVNLYDSTPGSTSYYLAFDGLRHAALVDNTANTAAGGAALSYTKLLGLRGLMVDNTYLHDWGHPNDPSDLVYVCDPACADDICDLDEVVTVDKYGPNAVVLTGEVANIGRHPLISSMAMAQTRADGFYYNGGSNTLSNVLAFNKRAFVVGIRRALKIETERIVGSDQTRILLSTRLGFGRFSPTGAASGIEGCAQLVNL